MQTKAHGLGPISLRITTGPYAVSVSVCASPLLAAVHDQHVVRVPISYPVLRTVSDVYSTFRVFC
jgi:hypothetical protein